MRIAGTADFEWLNRALFVEGGFEAGAGAWIPLRRQGVVHRIIPRERATTSAVFSNEHAGMGERGRKLRRLASRWGGPLLRLAPANQRVVLAPSLGLRGDPTDSALAALGQRFPRAAHLAITLGPERANRKPVVQLFDDTGRTICFAKVACDPTTAALVENEQVWLRRLDAAGTAFSTPTVLEQLRWQDRPIVAVSPVPAGPSTPVDPATIVPELLAVAGPVDRRFGDVVAEPGIVAGAPSAELDEIAAVASDRFGGEPVTVAWWHGDLSPWNLLVRDGHPWLIDWEFAAPAMPVGVDLVHHELMKDVELDGLAPDTAIARARSSFPSVHRSCGGAGHIDAAATAWLIRLAARELALDPSSPLAAAALRELRKLHG